MEQIYVLAAFAETCDFFFIFQNQSVAGNVIKPIKNKA